MKEAGIIPKILTHYDNQNVKSFQEFCEDHSMLYSFQNVIPVNKQNNSAILDNIHLPSWWWVL